MGGAEELGTAAWSQEGSQPPAPLTPGWLCQAPSGTGTSSNKDTVAWPFFTSIALKETGRDRAPGQALQCGACPPPPQPRLLPPPSGREGPRWLSVGWLAEHV